MTDALAFATHPTQQTLIRLLSQPGYALVSSQPRSPHRFFEAIFRTAHGHEIVYRQDHILGISLLYTRQSASLSSLDALLGQGVLVDLVTAQRALRQALDLDDPAAILLALAQTCGLASLHEDLPVELPAMLRRLASHAHLPIRSATLTAVAYLPTDAITDLLHTWPREPALSAEIDRQLTLRAAAKSVTVEIPALKLPLTEIFADRPVGIQAHTRRSLMLQKRGEPTRALVELYAALALSRRAGAPLYPHMLRASILKAAVETSTADDRKHALVDAVQILLQFLAQGEPHIVEEICAALSPILVPDLPLRLCRASALLDRGRTTDAAALLSDLLPAIAGLATPQVFAQLAFLTAQTLVDLGNAPGAQQIVAQVPEAQAVAGATVDEPWAKLLALVAARYPQPSHRDWLFLRAHIAAQIDRPDRAHHYLNQLLAVEPTAADAWLAQTALLLQLRAFPQALIACEAGEESLLPLDRMLEEVDPRAILRLRRALALCALDQSGEAALTLALSDDPRCLTADGTPLPASLAPLVDELTSDASQTLLTSDLRMGLRRVGAACIRSIEHAPALRALLVDFFAALLRLSDEVSDNSILQSRALSLLASVEAQLAWLSHIDEHAATPSLHAALADVAELLGV